MVKPSSPSMSGSTKTPLGPATPKSGSSFFGGSSGSRGSPSGSYSGEGYSGSSKKGSGGVFLNSERSGRLNVSVNRHGGRDGHYFFGGHKKDYYCGCHRPRHDCRVHSHSSFWMGFGFCSYPAVYPVYPVYPVYTWPVYETVVVPTYVAQPVPVAVPVAAPMAVPGAVAMEGQSAPGVEVQTPGAYATVPPGQEMAQQPLQQAVPQAQPQQEQTVQPPAEQVPQEQAQPPAATPAPSAPDANQSGGMPTDEMDHLMKEGVEVFAGGEYEKAAQNFMKVSMAMPDNVDALLAYAVARFATGDYANSATAIRRAVRKVPDVVNSLFDLRDRYGKMSDFDGHVGNLVRYVNEKKEDVDGWLVLGFVQHFIGDRQRSKETFEGVKKRSSADADVATVFINAKPLDQLTKEAQAAAAEDANATQPSTDATSVESRPASVGQTGPEAPAAPAPGAPAKTLGGDFSEPFGAAPTATRPA